MYPPIRVPLFFHVQERRKSAQRRRNRQVALINGENDVARIDSANSSSSNNSRDDHDADVKRREEEIMRQIDQKKAELDQLRSLNRERGVSDLWLAAC